MRITKKILPEYFSAVQSGQKKFELRLADFEVKEGDILVLQEWDPAKQEYTGREIEKEVSYVIKTKDINFWLSVEVEKFGYQIISLK